MRLCSHNHDEICFESNSCPLCGEREQLEEQINDLLEDVANYKDRIESLTETIKVLETTK